MIRSLLVFLILCSIATISNGQSIVRGPYLQKSNSDRITIKWRTDQPTESKVEYGTNLFNLDLAAVETSLKTEHEIELLSLSPNTVYYYRIADFSKVLMSEANDLYFKTSPEIGSRDATRFWILGDCGTANNNQRTVRDAYYNHVGGEHTDGILFLGDNAYASGTDQQYQNAVFENMYEDKLKNSVAWSCLGNHDGHSADSDKQTGPYYDIFSFPTAAESGGMPSGTEAYYSFDYGNIHFVSLDSYETDRSVGGSMYNWLENDLQNNLQEWLVVFWHHPPYTKGSHNSDTESDLIEMRQNFVPLVEEYDADLILSGHSHSYERSYFLNGHYGSSNSFDLEKNTIGDTGGGDGRIDGGGAYEKSTNGVDGKNGAVYITTGSAGKITGSGGLNHSAMFYSVKKLGSCILEVEEDQMNVKFIRENGSIEDYFTINKTTIDCTVGAPCDDGNPATSNDIYNTDCICIGGGVQTKNVCLTLGSGSDDAEEVISSGVVNIKSTDLEMVEEDADQLIGLRFPQSILTDTTVITSAYLQFTVDERGTKYTLLEINGEIAANPAPYTTDDFNISSRLTTDASVFWNPPAWNTLNFSGADQKTPDLSIIINEIINDPTFSNNTPIALQIKGFGKRVAESFNGSPAQAPKLCLEYESFSCQDIGKPCDDEDPCTANDSYDNDCNCIGIFQDSDRDGICDTDDLCAGGEPGTPCSDGDPCTTDDTIDNNCNCVGIIQDADNDTVCDLFDNCPDLDDTLLGTACNDNDACTINDIYTVDCECVGVYVDSDGDGVCNTFDVCFGPEPGTACDDNNVCTIDDKVDNNCNCVGTFQDADNDTVCDALDSCPELNDALIGTPCDDNNVCTNNDTYNSSCNCVGTFEDSDNDGICNAFDVCFGLEPGTACDDNNVCTTDDKIDQNCECKGTFQDADNDTICDALDNCPELNDALIGTPCDDNNTCTINDTYNSNCNCIGTFDDTDNDGVCDTFDVCPGLEPGAACDDNDICTINDVIGENCECKGEIRDMDDDGVCDDLDSCPFLDNSLIGTPCNDGDICTVGETYDTTCTCSGGVNLCLQKVYARFYLEGYLAIDSTNMNTTLNKSGLLPTSQPYNKAPWNYSGNESRQDIPADIVDWVLIMVRDANGVVIDQKAGFVNKIGELIDVDGTDGISMLKAINNYISIHHRSHVAVLTSSTYQGNLYDFSTSTFKANGTEQLILKSGEYCLRGGDYDGNGIINSVDFNMWKAQGAILNQYLSIDSDGNGIVNSLDYNIWSLNRSKLGHPFLRY